MRRGGKEQVVAHLGMRTDPGSKKLWNREGDEEVENRKQEAGSLAFQPLVAVDLAAERTVTIVAGVKSKMEVAAVFATENATS